MKAPDAVTLYEKAMVALSLPGLTKADKKRIAGEFTALIPSVYIQSEATVRAVRSAILKEADRAIQTRKANTSGKAPKAPSKRQGSQPRPTP